MNLQEQEEALLQATGLSRIEMIRMAWITDAKNALADMDTDKDAALLASAIADMKTLADEIDRLLSRGL